jgi:hypothetical protein
MRKNMRGGGVERKWIEIYYIHLNTIRKVAPLSIILSYLAFFTLTLT